MQTSVATAAPSTPISQIAKMMADRDVGSVVITDNGKPLGIVTDRDLVVKHLAAGHLQECEVREAMSSDHRLAKLATVGPDMDILDAVAEMGKRKVGRLPVIENDHLVGIISAGDLTNELHKAQDSLMVEGAKAHH